MYKMRNNAIFVLITVTLFYFAIFFSCDKNPADDDSDSTAQITGSLILPADATGKPFIVAVDDNFDADDGFTKVKAGTCVEGLNQEYTIANVPSGAYYIYAVVWVVAAAYATPESGDYVGYYGTNGTIPNEPNAVVPKSGTKQFDITLVILP